MLSQISRTIAEHQLVAPGGRLLVAVSGGPDSTALLEALVRLRARLGIELEVGTVDHGLRPESAEEVRQVLRRCEALGLRGEGLTVDVRAAGGPHISRQDAARRARLGALEALAERRQARVALGHTADDQAETIFFRIVRGTGLAGLRGIPYRRGPFVRPLLDVRRREVLRFLARHRLPYVEDASNRDLHYARSRIRHRWLPLLIEENPRIVDALLGLGRAARGADAAPAVLGRDAAAVIARLAAAGAGTKRVSVARGVVEVSYGQVIRLPGPEPLAVATPPVAVTGPGVYRWPPGGAAPVEIELALVDRPGDRAAILFDPGCLREGLVLRAPRPGDRMRPRGGRGSRKLQDLLVDAKVPRPRRAHLPVLATEDGTILFVPGLRPAEHGRPLTESKRCLQVWVR